MFLDAGSAYAQDIFKYMYKVIDPQISHTRYEVPRGKVHMHAHIHTYTHTCTHTHMHTHIHTYIHAHIHTCTHTHMHTHAHTHAHTHTHTHTHIHSHTHIHTNAYTIITSHNNNKQPGRINKAYNTYVVHQCAYNVHTYMKACNRNENRLHTLHYKSNDECMCRLQHCVIMCTVHPLV